MKDDKLKLETQYNKFSLSNRKIELEAIKKNKAKLKAIGYYVHITKYFPDYIPKETSIFIPEGTDERKRIVHFVEKRKRLFSTYFR